MGHASRLLVVSLLMMVAAACGKDAAEVTNEYRPKVEPRLKQMVAMVKAYPSIEKGQIDKLRFSGSQPNALLAQPKWLEGEQDSDALLARVGPVVDVEGALRGQPPIDGTTFESSYKAFLGAKYLVLISTSVPVVVAGDGFAAGTATGSFEIFEIASGKKLDAVSFEAKPPDSVTVAEGKAQEGVAADLKQRLARRANEAIAPYLADGERPPF